MAVHNPEISQALSEIADLLELEGANQFRIRAYRNAARLVDGLPSEISFMLQHGKNLAELPGIGADLAAKIGALARTGKLPLLDRLRKTTPVVATELLKLPGLGPKRVHALCHDLDIHSLAQLRRAIIDGRIEHLRGFGKGIQAKLLAALETEAKPARVKLAVAESYVTPLLAWLAQAAGVIKVVAAGSYRRCQETVGDIDILVTASRKSDVIARFTSYEEVKEITSAGTTRASVTLRSGLQVDLRVVPKESYGSALHYFTGSKAHNIAIRRLGQQHGLKINEYGIYRGSKRLGGATEEEVYRAVGLPYIPPELRENRGEIEAAAQRQLPHLIELDDLHGDLHTHTKSTDGHNSFVEMAAAAKTRGLSYIAVTDHSRHLTVAHGLDPKRLHQQMDAIDRFNQGRSGIVVLKGIEVDILEDGSLDLPDSTLKELDLVIGAVHSQFNLSRAKQTERILRAMENKYFSVLAHPSGRLIDTREPYDVDMPRIIHAAKERGCFLELNAYPERLDLIDLHCRIAKEEGVLISIATDSHRIEDLANLRLGIGQARRGWLERPDVLNTRTLSQLKPLLAGTMG